MGAYASESEVRPLLGNLKNQIDVSTINLASDAAESEINRITNHTNGWINTEPDYNAIKKAGRLITASECLYNVAGADKERNDMLTEAMTILQTIMKFDTSASAGDYVSVTSPVTYPANPLGVVLPGSRYPNGMNRHTQDSRQYDVFFDNPP